MKLNRSSFSSSPLAIQCIRCLCTMMGFLSVLSIAQPKPIIVDTAVVEEGNQGSQTITIPVLLQKSSSYNMTFEVATIPLTATTDSDFLPLSKTIVFHAGKTSHGLLRPENSRDPITAAVSIEDGFGLEMLVDLDRPAPLAMALEVPGFPDGLYVGQPVSNNPITPDRIAWIPFNGTSVEVFTTLLPEADPTSLAFAPPNSIFNTGLYLSANNRDGNRPGDWGGTIQHIDNEIRVSDFTAVGSPSGPGEPGEFIFGEYGWAEDLMILANSVGSPGDLLSVKSDGRLEVLFSDGQSESSPGGLAFRSLAMPPSESTFGDWLYLGEFGRECLCIQRWHPERGLETWIDEIEGEPHGMAFGRGGIFGNDLYVAIDLGNEGRVLRITKEGVVSEFITGLQGFLFGNGKDVMEFGPNGDLLYLSDYYGHRIYRIGAEESSIEITILGDTLTEPDETFLVSLTRPNGSVAAETLVTILNDDGAVPEPEPEPIDEHQLSIEFTTPRNHNVFALDFNTFPAIAEIPIELNVSHEKPIVSLVVLANHKIIHHFTQAPYRFVWTPEKTGDYLLEAKIIDSKDNRATTNPRRIQVIPYSERVLVIEKNDESGGQQIKEALFDMGLQSTSKQPETISDSDLIGIDLIIWKKSLEDALNYPALAEQMLQWNLSGKPTYLLTSNPSVSESPISSPSIQWQQLTGLKSLAVTSDAAIQLSPLTPANEPFLEGQYGQPDFIHIEKNTYSTLQQHPHSISILETDLTEHPVMLGTLPIQTGTETSGKLAIQLFSMEPGSSDQDNLAIRSIFQNTVCWLMDCLLCENMDLSVGMQIEDLPPSETNQQKVAIHFNHQGECVGSGVSLDIQWSSSLKLAQWKASAGWQEPITNGLRFHLGAVTSASHEVFELEFAPTEKPTPTVMATVHALNGESMLQNNTSIKVLSHDHSPGSGFLTMIALPNDQHGVFAQRPSHITGEWQIEWSKNLKQWTSIGILEGSIVIPIKDITPKLDENLFFKQP
ncbi:MAG: hypothetical protein HOH33_07615 [Verrucomicrobia bacterium]|jgi:hypothetical protein|nr:hypothetical protein [Verrucomicrobiota bacterium]